MLRCVGLPSWSLARTYGLSPAGATVDLIVPMSLDGVTIQALLVRLGCSVCGSRDTSIRSAYTGAGEFHYGGGTTPSSNSAVSRAAGAVGTTMS